MTAQPAADAALRSIGEVLAALRVDFPDTTISKLRFLESEGLVQPQRTASGYRKYSRDDVARLYFILTAQRDHYLPLRVIRQQLDDGHHLRPLLVAVREEKSEPPVPAPAPLDLPVPRELEPPERDLGPSGSVDRAQLCARAGITDALLKDLEQHGLISSGPGGRFDADALAIAQVAGQLAEFGVQPRHLRPYRVAADRDAGLFAQLLTPLLRQQDPSAPARAAEIARELVLLSQQLHGALLRSSLGDTLSR